MQETSEREMTMKKILAVLMLLVCVFGVQAQTMYQGGGAVDSTKYATLARLSSWTSQTFMVRTGADTTNATRSTGTVIGGLETNLANAGNYEFEFNIPFNANTSTSTGLALYVTVAGATTISYDCFIPAAADGTSAMYCGWGTASADTVMAQTVQAVTVVYIAKVHGYVLNATAGALRCWFKGYNIAGTITVKQFAWGRVRQF
jgi:hypothetical protein